MSSNFDISKGPVFAKWFDGAVTNLAYNCLDRHIEAGNVSVDHIVSFFELPAIKDFLKISSTYIDQVPSPLT